MAKAAPRVSQENWKKIRGEAVLAAAHTRGAFEAKGIKRGWQAAAGARLAATLRAKKLPDVLHPDREVLKWYKRFQAQYTLEDAPRPGPPPKLTETDVSACLMAMLTGDFETVKQFEAWPLVANTLLRCQVRMRQLLNRMRKLQEEKEGKKHALGKSQPVEEKKDLPPEMQQQRIDLVGAWLRAGINPNGPGVRWVQLPLAKGVAGPTQCAPIPPDKKARKNARLPPTAYLNVDELVRFVFIDAKKFFLQTGATYKQWAARGTPSKVKPKKKGLKGKCIEYYAAVNYELGGVLIKEVSGTRGERSYHLPVIYKVRAAAPTAPARTTASYTIEPVRRAARMHASCPQSCAAIHHHPHPGNAAAKPKTAHRAARNTLLRGSLRCL
jgi:hypothetical protein